MQINDIMTDTIVTVEMDDTLNVINEIFTNSSFHHLLVVESNKLLGVISDRDLFKAISPNIGSLSETVKDAATLNKKVHQIMTRKPVTLKTGADIVDAIAVFNTHAVSCIPVLNDADRPVGILSWRDILKSIDDVTIT